jgi:hypothetical protein
VLKLDWAEPGDPPVNNFALKGEPPRNRHLAAPPLGRRKAYPTNLGPRTERELIRRWREDYDEAALNVLVEAFRPKVVNMAQRHVGAKRKLLIEYGMFGLRLAASPQWPNRKREGAMAGYNPSKARFISYARFQADRLMRDAASAMRQTTEYDSRLPLRFQDTKEEFKTWRKTPIPPEVELACANNPDEPEPKDHIKAFVDEEFGRFAPQAARWEDGKTESGRPRRRARDQYWHSQYFKPWYDRFAEHLCSSRPNLQDPQHKYEVRGNPNCFCIAVTDIGPPVTYDARGNVELRQSLDGRRCLVYWMEGYFVYAFRFTKEAKERNYLASKVTELERENRRKYYEKYGARLATHDNLAEDGMGGWEGEGDDANDPRDCGDGLFSVHNGERLWHPCTGAFRKDKYKLPEKVLRQRCELARKRSGAKLPYKFNGGLGLYDRRGRDLPIHLLPQFDLSIRKLTLKKRRNAPVVCLKPLSGIYLVRGEAIGFRRIAPLTRWRLGFGCLRLCIRGCTHSAIQWEWQGKGASAASHARPIREP